MRTIDSMTGSHCIPQRHTDRIPIRNDHWRHHLKTKITKSAGDDWP
jgi:hypothetical protein